MKPHSTAADILNKASFEAKTLRISMGNAFINNPDKNRMRIQQVKKQALERLNHLENMINKRINQGVSELLEKRPTIQNNPFFKHKKPIKGLNDLTGTMRRKNDGNYKDSSLDVMTKEKLLNAKFVGKLRLQRRRDENQRKKKTTNLIESLCLKQTGKAASVGIRGSRKNQALSRKSTAAKKKGFRINGRLKGKKTVKAKWIPKDVRQGNPFANLPVIKDDDLRDGVYTLVNQGFIPKEVDVEPILARDQGILNIKKASNEDVYRRWAIAGENTNRGFNSYLEAALSNDYSSRLQEEMSGSMVQLYDTYTGRVHQPESQPRTFNQPNTDHSYRMAASVAMKTSKNYSTSFPATKKNNNLSQPGQYSRTAKEGTSQPGGVLEGRNTATASQKVFLTNNEKMRITSGHMREQLNPEDIIKDQLDRECIQVEGGKVLERDPAFLKFKGKQFYKWGDVKEVLDKLVEVLGKLGITNVKLLTSKVVALSDFMREPTRQELVQCVENYEMVLEYSKKRPKDHLKMIQIQNEAALVVQKFYRKFLAVRYLKKLMVTKTKLGKIQRVIKIWCRYRKTKGLIHQIKENMCQEYLEASDRFSEEWDSIVKQPRVEVHLNSLGYDRFQKITTPNYKAAQNSQLSRIFRLIDPNVEIIYVAPFDIQLEVLSYYVKILDILGIPNVSERIHLITPENYKFFEKNNLTVSNLLYYSPLAINKVIQIIGEKPSYIVGGYPSFDDLKLALRIGSVFVTGNPFINKKFLNIYESLTLFNSCKIPVPKFSPIIKSGQEMSDVFANLLLEYPEVARWEFNIVDEFHGRGKANFRTDSIAIMTEIRNCFEIKDRLVYLEPLKEMIGRFLPSNLNPASNRLFRNFFEYKHSFLACGGIIKAMGNGQNHLLGAQYFIKPNGECKFLASYEILTTKLGLTLGYISPQAQLPEKVISSIGLKVCKQLLAEGVIGYVGVQISVRTKGTNTLKMTITSAKPYYSEFLAGFEMFKVLDTFEPSGAASSSHRSANSSQALDQFKDASDKPRKCIILPRINNINTPSDMDYIEFFDECRKQGIYYDVLKKSGTVFMLSDDIEQGSLGMIIIDTSFRQLIKYATKALSYIGALTNNSKSAQRGDSDQRANIVNTQSILDLLYVYQKKVE